MTTAAEYHYGDLANHIDGSASSPQAPRLEVVDPSDGRVVGSIPDSGADEVDAAVRSAQQAFEGPWGQMRPSERVGMLHALADALADKAEELAMAEVRDNGKVVREMRTQLRAVPKWYRYFAGLADKLHGEVVPLEQESIVATSTPEPLGVIGCITPWNSPIFLAAWKLAPALAAGNTVVIKPSEHASVSTLLMAQAFTEAGLPPGVVNVVTGGGPSTGQALASHPLVRKLSFTGSEGGGRAVAATAAARGVGVGLELGGKSANIVFQDAPLDAAVNGLLAGIFAAAGQTCVAGSRALVHRSVHEEVVERLLARQRSIVVGHPLDERTEMGPIANPPQLAKTQQYCRIAHEDGAELLAGGDVAQVDGAPRGLYFQPTVLGGVRPDMRIAQEEVFGPILSIIPFDDEDEAISIANGTRYGLAAGVWTQDLGRAHRAARRLQAGTVWVNMYRANAPAMPFGGYKDSGLGRENGRHAVEEFLQTKATWIETEPAVADPFTVRA